MTSHKKTTHTKIGLALGSGSSRGWAHIGIIRELESLGITPDIVCGCSVGALVGASYISGNLDKLEQWARSLNKIELARFFDLNLSLTSLIDKENLQNFFEENVCSADTAFESLATPFATVSTDLETGKEIWFQQGSVLDAVWASIALPGLFPPIQYEGKWLIDGGLVNPVPISLCHALGADIVIAVNLNGDILNKHFLKPEQVARDDDSAITTFKKNVKAYSASLFGINTEENGTPSLLEAISGAIHITQDRITRSRMAGDPPDILISPRLSHIGLLEFFRAEEVINEGRTSVKRMEQSINEILKIG